MAKKYYITWIEHYEHQEVIVDTYEAMLAKVTEIKTKEAKWQVEEGPDAGRAIGLNRVIYGEECEFEPVQVETKWRMKE